MLADAGTNKTHRAKRGSAGISRQTARGEKGTKENKKEKTATENNIDKTKQE